jgi:hypothetical protein
MTTSLFFTGQWETFPAEWLQFKTTTAVKFSKGVQNSFQVNSSATSCNPFVFYARRKDLKIQFNVCDGMKIVYSEEALP